jgi:hypothetical protein
VTSSRRALRSPVRHATVVAATSDDDGGMPATYRPPMKRDTAPLAEWIASEPQDSLTFGQFDVYDFAGRPKLWAWADHDREADEGRTRTNRRSLRC